MKKSSSILGSIALSAALVMGTAVPAFAAVGTETAPGGVGDTEDVKMGTTTTNAMEMRTRGNESGTNEDGTHKDDGASTIVQASTYTSQLNVTIPLSVPLKFDTVGGEGLAPSNNAYYIKNNSSTNIKVIKADFAVTNSEWDLADGAITDAAAAQPLGNVAVGDFYLKIAPTAIPDVSGAKLDDLELKSSTSGTPAVVNRTSGTAPLNWGIKNGQKYGFSLAPSSSKLKKSVDDAVDIASITYTVGVGTDGAVLGTGTVDPDAGGQTFAQLQTKYGSDAIIMEGSTVLTAETAGTNEYIVTDTQSKDRSNPMANWAADTSNTPNPTAKQYALTVQTYTAPAPEAGEDA